MVITIISNLSSGYYRASRSRPVHVPAVTAVAMSAVAVAILPILGDRNAEYATTTVAAVTRVFAVVVVVVVLVVVVVVVIVGVVVVVMIDIALERWPCYS